MRAERLISLLMALQRGGRQTAGELAVRLDVSMRTIFRDIDALSTMGVPVYSEPGRGGGIRLIEGYTSDLTGLSSGEAEALALIASPASIGTSELATPTRTALDKLAAAVPSMHQLRAQHARVHTADQCAFVRLVEHRGEQRARRRVHRRQHAHDPTARAQIHARERELYQRRQRGFSKPEAGREANAKAGGSRAAARAAR